MLIYRYPTFYDTHPEQYNVSEEYQKKLFMISSFLELILPRNSRMQREMSIHSTAACGGAVKELKHRFTLEKTPKAQRGSRRIALLIL